MINHNIKIEYLVDFSVWKKGDQRRVPPKLAEILIESGTAKLVGMSPRNKMIKE
ncbi:MAG TPA: hypothetical protein VMW50_04295 [Dehalococcoidia bacterium]|nr:hypothetical protein [Dehalococcoidia bacterium]